MGRFNKPVQNRVKGGNTGAIMGFLPEGVRNHLVAWLAEFAGTFHFLFSSFSLFLFLDCHSRQHNTGRNGLASFARYLEASLHSAGFWLFRGDQLLDFLQNQWWTVQSRGDSFLS